MTHLKTLTAGFITQILFSCLPSSTDAPDFKQAALVDTLNRKSLRVSSAAKAELGAGKIVNLQSNDAGEWSCTHSGPAGGSSWDALCNS